MSHVHVVSFCDLIGTTKARWQKSTAFPPDVATSISSLRASISLFNGSMVSLTHTHISITGIMGRINEMACVVAGVGW